MKHGVLLLSAVVVGVASLGACLGRTGVSDEDIRAAGGGTPGGDDSALGDSSVVVDSGGPGDDTSVGDTTVVRDAPKDTAPPPSDGIDFFDLFPIPDSGPIGACATCVKDNCADAVNKCLNDPDCRAGMLCTITTCLAGGTGTTPDLTCVLGCFGGDFTKALEAINAFTCVIGKCGSSCGGIFGGGGDGGGPPPPKDAGPGPDAGAAREVPMSIDRPWTVDELMSLDPTTKISFSPDAFDAWKSQLQTTGGCGAK
jgi:hypothetical protein